MAEKLQSGRIGHSVCFGHGDSNNERSKPSFGGSVNGQDFGLVSGSLIGPGSRDLLSVVLQAFLLQSPCQPELVVGGIGDPEPSSRCSSRSKKATEAEQAACSCILRHTPCHIFPSHPGFEHGASESLQNCQSLAVEQIPQAFCVIIALFERFSPLSFFLVLKKHKQPTTCIS